MSELILSILTSAGVSGTLFVALTWLSKTVISERLKSAIKHEYEQKLEINKAQLKSDFDKEVETLKAKLKSESDKELETLKASLKSETDIAAERLKAELHIAGSEQQLLHDKVAETVAETYARLQRFHAAVTSYTKVSEFSSDLPKADRRKAVEETMEAFHEYYKPKKILIPKRTAEKIDKFEDKLFNIAQEFMWSVEHHDDSGRVDYDTCAKIEKAMSEEVPLLLELLEQEFQHLLGFKSTIKEEPT